MMKIVMIISLIFIAFTLSAGTLPVMLQVQGKVEIPEDFRDGVEEALIKYGYSLIDLDTQQNALTEQAQQKKAACYDDNCLVETGKMLAARGLIVAEVSLKGEAYYRFKVRYINFETGAMTRSKLLYYSGTMKDFKKIFNFAKDLTGQMLHNTKEPVVKTALKKEPVKTVEVETALSLKSRFKDLQFGVAIVTGYSFLEFEGTKIYNSEEEERKLTYGTPVIGIDGEITFYLSPSFGVFLRAGFLKGFPIDGEIVTNGDDADNDTVNSTAYHLLVGGRLNFGSLYGNQPAYYCSGGIGYRVVDVTANEVYYGEDGTLKGINVLLEGGRNLSFDGYSLDLFIALNYTYIYNWSMPLVSSTQDESALMYRFNIGARFNF